MKDYIKALVVPGAARQDNVNRVREYLQKYALYVLYRKKVYGELVFTGGTALRFLHGLRRYSEDLDFSLSQNEKGFSVRRLVSVLQNEFAAAAYNVEVPVDESKNVASVVVKFPGLLHEFGLSDRREEKLSIRLEVDRRPPAGGVEELSLHRAVFMFYILHYDLPSLFAGKIHALLTRPYTKGRDWYDLVWYLTRTERVEPNLVMLNNALKQTSWDGSGIFGQNWTEALKDAVRRMDEKNAKSDVGRFLEEPAEADLMTKANLLRLLESPERPRTRT